MPLGVCGHHAETRDATCARCLRPPIPVRVARPYCPTCGQADGHWLGCNKGAAA